MNNSTLEARAEVAERLAAAGKLEEAIREYQKLSRLASSDPAILNRLGDLFLRASKRESAFLAYERVAALYAGDGFYLKAIAIWKKIMRLDRGYLKGYDALAILYQKQGLLSEAARQLRLLADFMKLQGDDARAVELRHRADELDRDSAEAKAERVIDLSPADLALLLNGGSPNPDPVAGLPVTGVPIVRTKSDLVVFLCHASEDKLAVRELYRQLQADLFQPWLDEEELLPGQNWQVEIQRAVRRSHAVVVCLSKQSVTKAGFLQKEIKTALDVLEEQPEGIIFVVPARLQECKVPDSLSHLHYVDLFLSKGYDRLRKALDARAKQLGFQ